MGSPHIHRVPTRNVVRGEFQRPKKLASDEAKRIASNQAILADSTRLVEWGERVGLVRRPGSLLHRKLTPEQVSRIRHEAAAGQSTRAIAKRHGISRGWVWNLVNREQEGTE